MKVFPLFSSGVENTYLTAAGRADGTPAVAGARQMIDDAYIRINKAMWDSLKVIARESPTATAHTTGKDADTVEKELLNYHILLIENMHHYIEEVDDGGKEGSVLAEWKAKALMDRAEHMEEYVVRVVRRPLGKVIVSDLLVQDAETSANHSYRTLWKKEKECLAETCPGPVLRHNPRTLVAQRRNCLRVTIPRKSDAASTLSASVLRNILASRTKSSSHDSSLHPSRKNANVDMNRFWIDYKRSAKNCTKRRRSGWILTGPRKI